MLNVLIVNLVEHEKQVVFLFLSKKTKKYIIYYIK